MSKILIASSLNTSASVNLLSFISALVLGVYQQAEFNDLAKTGTCHCNSSNRDSVHVCLDLSRCTMKSVGRASLPLSKLCVLSCCINVNTHAYTDPIDCAVFVSTTRLTFKLRGVIRIHNKCIHPVVHRDATANSGFMCILASTARAASARDKYQCLLCRALPPGSSVCVCVIAPSVSKPNAILHYAVRLLRWGVNA